MVKYVQHITWIKSLNSHVHDNPRMWLVAHKLEILIFKLIDVSDLRTFDDKFREISRLPPQLFLERLNVIQIDMRISKCVYKLSWLVNTSITLY